VTSGIGLFVLAHVPAKPAIAVNVPSVTNTKQIKVSYGSVLPSNRGSPILNIQLWIDDGLGKEFSMVIGSTEAYSMRTSIVITDNIVKGRLYRLKYRVMNINGFSDYSDIAYIRAGVAPGRPQSPELTSDIYFKN
jgi:hypothetical protein